MRLITTQAELDAAGSEWVQVKAGAFLARGNSQVVACGTSHVDARGNSHVDARDTSQVDLYDFAVCHRLSDAAAIIAISPRAVIVDVDYPATVEEWAGLKGLMIVDGHIELWKAVDTNGFDFRTGQIDYLAHAVAPDWDANTEEECGYALHLADSPAGGRYFVPTNHLGTYRLLRVRAAVADCRVFPGRPEYPMKLRARACTFIEEVEVQR